MTELTYSRKLELRSTPDVLVVGGGPAGVAAAVMCARQTICRHGQTERPSVMLIERSGSLGGASVLAMVPEIMNFDDGEHFLAGGFGREVHDALFPPCAYDRIWCNVQPEPLKRLYDRLVTEAGVQLCFFTQLADAVCVPGEKRIDYVTVSAPDGIWAIRAKLYIDCTGSGLLCALAGAACAYGDGDGNAMSATLCSLWGGVDFTRLGEQHTSLMKALQEGVLPQYDTVLPGIKRNFPEVGVGGGNIGHCFGVDDRSAASLTKAMVEGRQIVAAYEEYYRRYVPGASRCRLLRTADFLGIRESRRVVCERMLTFDTFDRQEPFPDEIGRYSYPIDIHPLRADREGMQGFQHSVSKHHEKGHSYSIPYGCLLPKGQRNLLVAGRCIGADHEMQASVRVIPGCYITGQAAGVAAALSLAQDCVPAEVDIPSLQQRLREMGAYLLR